MLAGVLPSLCAGPVLSSIAQLCRFSARCRPHRPPFAANQLTGTVPPCLLASPPLQELYLGANALEGPLPAPPPQSRLLIISAFGMVGRGGGMHGANHCEPSRLFIVSRLIA